MTISSVNKIIEFPTDGPIDPRFEQVIGADDFQQPWFLHAGWKRSRCVGVIPNLGTCFLISDNIVMTNWHVFRTSEWAAGKKVVFEFEQALSGMAETTTVCEALPQEFFYSCEPLDFTILKISGEPGKARGFLDIRQEGSIQKDSRVNIIQHPKAEFKKIAIRNNGLKGFDAELLQYWTDTEYGSSGSPLFNDSWDLIGLHYLRDEAPSPEGTKIYFNVGHRISAIWKHLSDHGVKVY